MRRIVLVVVATFVASLALEGAALAAPETDTTFRMEDKGNYVEYKGTVTSDPVRQRCIRNRAIRIYHDGILIASTTTDADGKWKVNGPRPPNGDEVTVEVRKKRKRGKTICQGTEVTKTFQP